MKMTNFALNLGNKKIMEYWRHAYTTSQIELFKADSPCNWSVVKLRFWIGDVREATIGTGQKRREEKRTGWVNGPWSVERGTKKAYGNCESIHGSHRNCKCNHREKNWLSSDMKRGWESVRGSKERWMQIKRVPWLVFAKAQMNNSDERAERKENKKKLRKDKGEARRRQIKTDKAQPLWRQYDGN